jgi:hypothetical protein
MGKKGRKLRHLRIEIGTNETELRYTSLTEALAAALPHIAEAIIRSENSVCDTNPQPTPDPAPHDHEQHDLKD